MLNAQTENKLTESHGRERERSAECLEKRNKRPGVNELMVVWVYRRFDLVSGMVCVQRGHCGGVIKHQTQKITEVKKNIP